MKEIDLLSAVKFTDESGVMHLFPQEEKGRESFLRFRYVLTEVSATDCYKPDYTLTCSIIEKEFFIPDGGSSLYKDLYRLDPISLFTIGDNFSCYKKLAKDGLAVLGYSLNEIEERLKIEHLYKYIPVMDSDNLIILEEGQTYADAFECDNGGSQSFWEDGYQGTILATDLVNGMSIVDFFGDENAWDHFNNIFDKVVCKIDTRGYTRKTVKTLTL